jgi:hypothetical protein
MKLLLLSILSTAAISVTEALVEDLGKSRGKRRQETLRSILKALGG